MEESLENIDEPVDSTKIRKIQALLDISGLTAYRHIGDWKTAEKYFKRIEENNTCLTLDEYLGVKRSLWVCYCDGFMWDKALKCAEELLDNQEIMEDARRNIFPKSNKMSIDSGKACSICGQSLAYLRNDRAEKSFLKALECYEKETPDYYITLSYLLHFYIDNGEETKYKEYSKEYFGQNISLNAQFEYIFKEGLKNNPKFNLKYALFVFLKALYNFNKSSVKDSLWGKIRNVEEYVNKNFKKHIKENERWILEGHPSELIYKYIMLIAINRGDNETVIKCKYKFEKSLKNKAELIDYINYFSLIEVENERGNIKERNKMIREFAIRLKKESPAFRKIKIDSKPSDLYSSFKEKFTYMYC